MDAALADFSRLAGDANAALLRDYVAAVLGRHPQPPVADKPASAGGAGASEPAAAAAQPAACAAEIPDGSAAFDAGSAAPAAGATVEAAAAGTAAAGSATIAAPGSGPSRGRPPRHVVLQPIADKHSRGAVHGFFKAEPRLPPMRTETFQSTVKEGSNTVRNLRHHRRLLVMLLRGALYLYASMPGAIAAVRHGWAPHAHTAGAAAKHKLTGSVCCNDAGAQRGAHTGHRAEGEAEAGPARWRRGTRGARGGLARRDRPLHALRAAQGEHGHAGGL